MYNYKTLCVVNPTSANGRTRKTWGQLESYLRRRGLVFDVMCTSAPKNATDITREALLKDYRRIVSVGGDGTLNEVVNGFFDEKGQKIKEDAFLSIIPMGTGGDFARMFEVSSKPHAVYEMMAKGREIKIDIVRGAFTGWRGNPEFRYYINVADVGLGSETVYYVNRNSKILRGFLSFLVSALYSVFTFKNKLVTVIVDGQEVYTGKSNLVVASNGSYFGGGMKIAPHANLSDGLLEIIIARDLSKLELLRCVPKIYSGKHLEEAKIFSLRGQKVQISSPEEIFVEFDGESPGKGDLVLEIIPQGMKLII